MSENPKTPDPTPQPPVEFNDMAILSASGDNPAAVRALLTRHRQPAPSEWAIYQWKSRKRITNVWRAPLIFALMSEGKINPAQLFRRGTPSKA